jgi:hypothetical protein
MPSRPGQIRVIHMSSARSAPHSRRRGGADLKAMMTEKKVLGFKLPPRLEQVGDEHSKRVQNRKHRPE